MKKAIFVDVSYVGSDTITTQGKQVDIQRYLNTGYIVKEERNGFWVLTRSAKVIVTLQSDNCVRQFNMKYDILNYYNRQRLSENLVETFKEEVRVGKITFEMNEDGTIYTLK